MKQVSKILGRMEAYLNGSLDGLELDNTDDVIEKSLVIEMVNDLKMLVSEAQQQVNNLSKTDVISCAKCCDNPEMEISYENNSNVGGSGNFGVTNKVFRCKNCGKPKFL